MKTQLEQVQQSSRAYLLRLNGYGSMTARYAVYLLRDGELQCLWPSDCHLGAKSEQLLCGQIYSKNRSYPAYHFSIHGCGFSKTYEIRMELERLNPSISVEVLDGASPSNA